MTPDERLADALDDWQVGFEAGHDRPAADLLPDHPDLHAELGRRVAVLRHMLAPPTITPGSVQKLRELTPAVCPHTTATPVSLPPGFVFERELGRGGMGVVYLAVQQGLGRPVALKMILDSAGPSAVIRFLVESEAVASVKHPNVVEVYQFGEHAGRPYLALEYCPGGDLTSSSKAGRTAPRTAAELITAVADGVNAAHMGGIVHRDLKPNNVLLTADGTPKVGDFGLAKRAGGGNLTGSEAVLGTPAYMSPEQAGGGTKFVGPECDVWALGVMLYELLTGQRPFAGPSFLDYRLQILGRHLTPLRQRLPDVPRDLELIVAKCLRQEPRERYATAGELAADLRNWLAGKPISARPMGSIEAAWKWSRRNPAVAGSLSLAVLALVAGTVVSLWQAHDASVQSDRATASAIALAASEAEARGVANALDGQLKEAVRLHDLSRLREAQAAWESGQAGAARQLMAGVSLQNRCLAWNILSRMVEGSEYTFWHTAAVTSVAYSPDGKLMIVGLMDNTLRVSDAVSGQVKAELKGHTGEVFSVAFSPGGDRVVTGSADHTAAIWDVVTGRELVRLTGHKGYVRGVTFSPDGQRVATASNDGTAAVWDATGRGELVRLTGHKGLVRGVAFSPDGQRVVTGSNDGTAAVWDATTGKRTYECNAKGGLVWGVAFSPDGTRIATTADKTVHVWSGEGGQPLMTLRGHSGVVGGLAYSPDGKWIATCAADNTIRVWDAVTGDQKRVFKGHLGEVTGVCFSPGGRQILSGSADGAAKVWDTTSDGQKRVSRVPDDFRSELSPDGELVLTGAQDGTGRVWRRETGALVSRMDAGHTRAVLAIKASRDGTRVVTGSEDTTAQVWDLKTGKVTQRLTGHARMVLGVAFSPDGRRVATSSLDGTARIWDTRTGTSLHELKGHTRRVECVEFSPDGRWVVTGSEDTTARVWDADTGRLLHELRGHTGHVFCVGFGPNGQTVVTGSADSTARVWQVETGNLLHVLRGHTAAVYSVLITADSTTAGDNLRIVTGSSDRSARIWDMKSGQALIQLNGHPAAITRLAEGADGRRLLIRSGDGVFDWAYDHQKVVELVGHSERVSAAAISPDGKRVVTRAHDDTLRVWDSCDGRCLAVLDRAGVDVQTVTFSGDGARIVTRAATVGVKVWDAVTGQRVNEQVPFHSPASRVALDGRLVVLNGVVNDLTNLGHVLVVETEVSTAELARRQWLGRPDPWWHETLASAYQDAPFAAAVQRSLEQQARGQLALKAFDFDRAARHFIAAMVLKPKPHPWPAK